jgi:hypothetical protein
MPLTFKDAGILPGVAQSCCSSGKGRFSRIPVSAQSLGVRSVC